MSGIAVFLAEGFEELEALTVVDLCRRAGLDTVTVSVDPERTAVTGSHGIRVEADRTIDAYDFDTADMLVLPGGMPGTTNLEACEALMEQVRAFDRDGRQIAAICAAPGILARAGLLSGRKAVSHPAAADALKEGGAIEAGEETARDGHIFTSRGVGTAIPFALGIIGSFCGEEKARAIADAIVFRA